MSKRCLLQKSRRERYAVRSDVAEAVGFEPTCPLGQPHFECGSLRPLRYASMCLCGEQDDPATDRPVPLEVPPGFEPGNEGFADLCLTTWLWHPIKMER